MLTGVPCHCYLCRDGCWIMWSAYHCVHGTSCFCTLSASACSHWALARFLFTNLFMETLSLLFFDENLFTIILLCSATHAFVVDASSSHVCIDEWLSTASTLCLLSLHFKAQAVSPSYAQCKAQMNHSQRISWLLVAVSNATQLHNGSRLAERRRKNNNSDFRP